MAPCTLKKQQRTRFPFSFNCSLPKRVHSCISFMKGKFPSLKTLQSTFILFVSPETSQTWIWSQAQWTAAAIVETEAPLYSFNIIFPNSLPTDFTRKQPYMWLQTATSHSTVCCLILHWAKSLSPDALERIMPQDYRKKKSQVLGKSETSISRPGEMLHSIHEQTSDSVSTM